MPVHAQARTDRRDRGMLLRLLVAVAVTAGLVLLDGVGRAHDSASGAPALSVLSNRADLVSGGDVLLAVQLPAGTEGPVRLTVNGRDASRTLARDGRGRWVGLVTGLATGRNDVVVRTSGGTARTTVVNHPASGPVFSGPLVQPWTCAAGTEGRGCTQKPTYTFLYKSSNPARRGLQPYDPQAPATDVATTTTDQGRTVPFIVRVETGSILRDEYKIAVLFQPGKPWQAAAPQPQWNRKLLITHGSSCDISYAAGSAPSITNDTVTGESPTLALSRGFAVMSHALAHAGHNCNVVTQAESLMMTKERVVEQYGELRYTIGTGCSGGALTQNLVANAYPGIYQGILTGCSFPDSWSGRMLYEDYSLLRRYFENPSRWSPGVAWAPDDLRAVMGHPNYVNAIVYNTAINPILDPSRPCSGVPADKVYSASNPNGVRCSMHDYAVNVFGRRADGKANRPLDNTGVQYGLKALVNGTITPSQFLDVNTKVGGRDIDYEPTQQRTAADHAALARVYRSGSVNTASNLDQVAIIDQRGPDPGAFHDVYRTYALRARLDREQGHHRNHVLWRGSVALVGDPDFQSEALLAMDRWLSAVEKDRSPRPLSAKILAGKPSDVSDRCTDGAPGGVDLPGKYCDAVVQSYSTARIEAGMPFTDDVVKCTLKRLDPSDYYPVLFSGSEWAALQKIFPAGVCDYRVPGVDAVDTTPWLDYSSGPGGRPLGAVRPSTTLPPPATR